MPFFGRFVHDHRERNNNQSTTSKLQTLKSADVANKLGLPADSPIRLLIGDKLFAFTRRKRLLLNEAKKPLQTVLSSSHP